jgi:error-prone DNA polymerase
VASPGARLAEGTQLALPLEVPEAPALRPLDAWQSMVADYATTGLTLGRHPMALLRPSLPEGVVSSRDLRAIAHDTPVRIGGLVVARQRPGTAKGIVFLLLEDEFGTINLIVPPPVYERDRLTVRSEPLLIAEGKLEKLPMAGGAINVYVRSVKPIEVPGELADVVPLPEREPEREAEREERAVAVPADFRGVAPPVQSFASGRRR